MISRNGLKFAASTELFSIIFQRKKVRKIWSFLLIVQAILGGRFTVEYTQRRKNVIFIKPKQVIQLRYGQTFSVISNEITKMS